MTTLHQAILKTLAYSDIFDFPLRISEIHRYLIEYSCSETRLAKLLYRNNPNPSELPRIKINEWQGYFYLGDKKPVVQQRIKREKIAREKLKTVKESTAVLQWIPWIKMVAVTGRVAALNCEDEDDIDLIILTQKNRLWLSRLFEFLILTGLRRRRKPHQTESLKDKLCPNMYLSEETLKLPHQDLFTANELARMKVVWEKDQAYQKLIEMNGWMKEFLPNWTTTKEQKAKNKKQKHGSKMQNFLFLLGNFSFCSSIFDLLERLARFLQIRYMKRKRTSEIIQNNLLMFHPEDMKEKVLKQYQQAITQHQS